MSEVLDNKYAQLLKEQGIKIVTTQGIHWYNYGRFIVPYRGFIMPAYLPHCCPKISEEIAQEALRISGLPFARWDSEFGKVDSGPWWYVLKRGQWRIEDVGDKKKRWMIRQGKKNFSVRTLTFDEVVSKCPRVAQLAAARYKGAAKVESQELLKNRVDAAIRVPGVAQYMGCFYEDKLVSFSEDYIQDNAVWLANIRHDPAFLNKYSSYALMDGILDYYLNQRKMDYVLDGCRSIHHRTNFQEHLMRVFAFAKEYAFLNVAYSAKFKIAIKVIYPVRNVILFMRNKWTNSFLDNVGSVLQQELIRRTCKK